MRRYLLLLSAAAAATEAQAQRSAAMFRGDPRHSGAYSAPTGSNLAGLQWRLETDGSVVSSPAILADTVWVGSADGKVYSIKLETGEPRWATDLGSPVTASPAVGGGRVIVSTRDGRVVCLSSSKGERQWQIVTGPDRPWPWGHESGDQWTSSPTLAWKYCVHRHGRRLGATGKT